MRILLISILALVLAGCKIDQDGHIGQDGRIELTQPPEDFGPSQIEKVYFSVVAGEARAMTGVASASSFSLGVVKSEIHQGTEFKAEIFLSPRDRIGVRRIEVTTDDGTSRIDAPCDSGYCALDISALLEEQSCGDETFVALTHSDDVFFVVHKTDESTQEFTFHFEPLCEATVAKTRIGERNIASVQDLRPWLSTIFVSILISVCVLIFIFRRFRSPKP
ncbi:MAG: hypothetical protein K2Q26_03830 [Bdellovibrionales bacterium]|nr:hypothetical protein [Bdellovibrionales bacterium]